MAFNLGELRREPDITAPELHAYDQADRLLLDTVADVPAGNGGTVVIGDRHGALTLGLALGQGVRGIRVFQDPLLHERALDRNAERLCGAEWRRLYSRHPLGEELLRGATLVVMQLPKSLDELDEIAQHLARHADPHVTVLAGGRVKHMTKRQNDVLGDYFGEVRASLARQKSRILTAKHPRENVALTFPKWGSDPDLQFEIASFGATFGGSALDHGSRLLLQHLPEVRPDAKHIVDLGSGNGSLAVEAARSRPGAKVIATDQSWGAVHATRATAERAGVADRVRVVRGDGIEQVPAGWADLILLNPPFHSGSIVTEEVAHRLMREAGKALAPGGTMLAVYNSHLGHRRVLEQHVGRVTQITRNRTFTLVTVTQGSPR